MLQAGSLQEGQLVVGHTDVYELSKLIDTDHTLCGRLRQHQRGTSPSFRFSLWAATQ